MMHAFLHDAPSIDCAAESVIECGDQRPDRREQEDRSHRELDGAGNVTDMRFHIDRVRREVRSKAIGYRRRSAESVTMDRGRHAKPALFGRFIGFRWRRSGFRALCRGALLLLAQPFFFLFLLLGQISLAFGKCVVGFRER